MRKATHFEKALACAILAHGGSLVAFGRFSHPPVAASTSDREPIEIHIEEEPLAAREPPAPEVPPTPPPELSPHRQAAAIARAGLDVLIERPEGIPASSAQRSDPEVAPAASGEPWTFSPTVAEGVWLGLRTTPDSASSLSGATGRRTGGRGDDDRSGTSEASNASRAVADSLRAALDAHDRDVGLGVGAPLVEPTREAVRTSLVPSFARAVLEFTTDRAGLVVSVRVVDASSDRQAWDEVADQITRDPRKKPLRMPPGARGLSVTMQVESKVLGASGQDPNEGILSRATAGRFEPTELLMDSNAKPRRVVVATVVHESRL